jgi:hypothetical protein
VKNFIFSFNHHHLPMSDNSGDVSEEFKSFLNSIDIQNTVSAPTSDDGSDVSAEFETFLNSIHTSNTQATLPDETTDSESASASPEGSHNPTEDEYHPSPVLSPVLYKHSSSDEEVEDMTGKLRAQSG